MNLRCFDKINPIGTNNLPYFGWFVNDVDNNEKQTAYQIIVSSTQANADNNTGDIWDSGKITSGSQNYVYYAGTQLTAATGYYWKVKTWDKDGNESPYSAASKFGTGLIANTDWAGVKWIKRDNTNSDDYTFFRKSFTLQNKTIKRAIAYVAACHSFELYVNGTFISKGFDNHYPAYSYYNALDITSALQQNTQNVIGCLTHWYGGGQGRATGARGLLLKAVIEYDDGTKDIVGTDGTWKQTRATAWASTTARNGEGIGYIEKTDSRKVIANWNTIGFDDSAWSVATEIGAHPVSPWTGTLRSDLTRVIENEIKPVSITNIGTGRYVIDLGKIYSGQFKINFSGGNMNDSIVMVGGYTKNSDGTVSTTVNQGTSLYFYHIHNGTQSTFNPYVYLGLRYLEVRNSPCALTTDNVSFIFRHFELDPSNSTFTSSNTMLNNVWDLMVHSLMVGAQEDFVDTPTREKGAFLGDGWSQAVPSLSVMNDRVMNLRSLTEFMDSQDQYWTDGRLNCVYPNVDGARDIPDYTQSFLVWAWDYYMQTGNLQFLQNNYARLKKIADYVATYKNTTSGLIHKLKGGLSSSGATTDYTYGIIDWPKSMRFGYDVTTDTRTVVDAYAYADFDIMSKISGATKNTTDSTIYRLRAEMMKQAINTKLINTDSVYIDGLSSSYVASTHASQHANMMPLALGIVPDKNIPKVTALIKSKKMSVGMVTLRWLPEAIGQANEGQHLIDLYTNTSWYGWAKTVARGGSVTWESWVSDSTAYNTSESLSHPWGAVGLLAMQNYMLGIKSLKPQNELIQIKPLFFDSKLTSAKGTYPTDRGTVSVDWNYSNTNYTLNVIIPTNITANVYIPKCGRTGNLLKVDGVTVSGIVEGDYICVKNVGSGAHIFESVSLTNGLKRNADQSAFQFYPNPAKDFLNIANPEGKIEIIDLYGKLWYTSVSESKIAISSLPNNVYIVKQTTENSVTGMGKFIKY